MYIIGGQYLTVFQHIENTHFVIRQSNIGIVSAQKFEDEFILVGDIVDRAQTIKATEIGFFERSIVMNNSRHILEFPPIIVVVCRIQEGGKTVNGLEKLLGALLEIKVCLCSLFTSRT